MTVLRIEGDWRRRPRFRIAAWLALLAMLLAAIAPAVSHALASGSDRGDLIEVCGVGGIVWVEADRGVADPGEDGSPDHAAMACPWCQLHGSPGALPAPQQPFLLLVAVPMPAAGADSRPAAAAVWPAAIARAPPLDA